MIRTACTLLLLCSIYTCSIAQNSLQVELGHQGYYFTSEFPYAKSTYTPGAQVSVGYHFANRHTIMAYYFIYTTSLFAGPTEVGGGGVAYKYSFREDKESNKGTSKWNFDLDTRVAVLGGNFAYNKVSVHVGDDPYLHTKYGLLLSITPCVRYRLSNGWYVSGGVGIGSLISFSKKPSDYDDASWPKVGADKNFTFPVQVNISIIKRFKL